MWYQPPELVLTSVRPGASNYDKELCVRAGSSKEPVRLSPWLVVNLSPSCWTHAKGSIVTDVDSIVDAG
jgi:hypothetical protein